MGADGLKVTLYDFAYIDRERAKSLNTQLFSGLRTSVQKSSEKTHSNTHQGGISVGITGLLGQTEQTASGDSKTYDPHDLTYLDLVNTLRGNGYLKENQSTYQVGDIILVTGKLSMFNFDAMAPLVDHLIDPLENPLLDNALVETQLDKAFLADTIDLVTETYPATIQFNFQTGKQTIWGVIDGANSREPIDNIMLKYGPSFPGTWHMLAIVDVVDDAEADTSCFPEIARVLLEITDKLRPVFGRPHGQIGVTPLLLFRKLSK